MISVFDKILKSSLSYVLKEKRIREESEKLKTCEYCGELKERVKIDCPDEILGCAVFHFKLKCSNLCEYKEGN
jgi:hypothetical protein